MIAMCATALAGVQLVVPPTAAPNGPIGPNVREVPSVILVVSDPLAPATGVGVGLFLMSGSRVLPGGSTALRLAVDVGPDRAIARLGGSW